MACESGGRAKEGGSHGQVGEVQGAFPLRGAGRLVQGCPLSSDQRSGGNRGGALQEQDHEEVWGRTWWHIFSFAGLDEAEAGGCAAGGADQVGQQRSLPSPELHRALGLAAGGGLSRCVQVQDCHASLWSWADEADASHARSLRGARQACGDRCPHREHQTTGTNCAARARAGAGGGRWETHQGPGGGDSPDRYRAGGDRWSNCRG
mmetsp:Transcript_44359/g.108411  ORF Transcript_44359/g.108411 Transcript_44359/m.108411 type:complete len:206 (+) Transcript_44359:422-1039(+)